jgi:hypothetical protein
LPIYASTSIYAAGSSWGFDGWFPGFDFNGLVARAAGEGSALESGHHLPVVVDHLDVGMMAPPAPTNPKVSLPVDAGLANRVHFLRKRYIPSMGRHSKMSHIEALFSSHQAFMADQFTL